MPHAELSPAELLSQAYEAFDTIAEDAQEIELVIGELASATQSLEDYEDLGKLRTGALEELKPRTAYVLKSLYKVAVSNADLLESSVAYANSYSEDQRASALKRAISYNRLLEDYRHGDPKAALSYRGDIEKTYSGRKRSIKFTSPDVDIYGVEDYETGKVWVSIGDARAVRLSEPEENAGEILVTEYRVLGIEADDNRLVITVKNDSNGITQIKTTLLDDKYRLSEDGKTLQLYIPRDAMSLCEYIGDWGVYELEPAEEMERRLAIEETGADLPNIVTTYEYPDHANPVPVTVAKRD